MALNQISASKSSDKLFLTTFLFTWISLKSCYLLYIGIHPPAGCLTRSHQRCLPLIWGLLSYRNPSARFSTWDLPSVAMSRSSSSFSSSSIRMRKEKTKIFVSGCCKERCKVLRAECDKATSQCGPPALFRWLSGFAFHPSSRRSVSYHAGRARTASTVCDPV